MKCVIRKMCSFFSSAVNSILYSVRKWMQKSDDTHYWADIKIVTFLGRAFCFTTPFQSVLVCLACVRNFIDFNLSSTGAILFG